MNDTVPQTPGLNPFLPFSTYIPDGEPKVFGDRVYLYGSYDIFGSGYCSKEYHVVSAPVSDLTRWTDHGVSFRSDNVPWSDEFLYAPDVLYRNGRYYLFFCMSDGSEGVADSTSPAGPFENARRITLAGEPIHGIDPSVLEDHGRIYYTWGQFRLHMAELNTDMCTLKPETLHDAVITNADGGEGFHEGSSLRKLGKHYCLVYASEYTDTYPNHGGRPTKLDYAISASPYGPYERRGTVIDNEGCDPASWNNHGSVTEIGGRWYVFYHASSNNTAFSRRARAERLNVDVSRGIIEQARPTTNGFVETLLPRHITSPVNACRFFGGAYVTERTGGVFPATGLRNGAGFEYSPILFEDGTYSLTVCYRAFAAAGLRVCLGNTRVIDGELPGSLKETCFRFTAHMGLLPLRIEVYGPENTELCEIESLQMIKQPD